MKQKSHIIIEKFSTYIIVKPEGVNYFIPTYQTNVRLKKIISTHLKSYPNQEEKDYIYYFIELLKKSNYQDKIAQELVFCYLQTACWFAAQKVSRDLSQTTRLNLHYSLEDCFMIACELTLQFSKILDNFNPQTNFAVQTYVQAVLVRMIKNKIVGEVKAKSLKFSDQGLLKNTSKSQLKNSLFAYGLTEKEVFEYCLVFQAFKDLYCSLFAQDISQQTKLKQDLKNSLNSQQCQLIIDRVKQQRKRLQKTETLLTETQIKQILNFSCEAIRNFQNRQSISLDLMNKELETADSCLDLLTQAEESQDFTEFKQMINQQFLQSELKPKQAIYLWLGLDIKQIDLTDLLEVKQQFQVSRELKKYLKKILKNVTQTILNNKYKLTAKAINQLCNDNLQLIKDYLQSFCSQHFNNLLLNQLKDNKQLLPDCLNQQTQLETVINLFRNKVEENLKLKLAQFSSSSEKINDFVRNYLLNNRALLLKLQTN